MVVEELVRPEEEQALSEELGPLDPVVALRDLDLELAFLQSAIDISASTPPRSCCMCTTTNGSACCPTYTWA